MMNIILGSFLRVISMSMLEFSFSLYRGSLCVDYSSILLGYALRGGLRDSTMVPVKCLADIPETLAPGHVLGHACGPERVFGGRSDDGRPRGAGRELADLAVARPLRPRHAAWAVLGGYPGQPWLFGAPCRLLSPGGRGPSWWPGQPCPGGQAARHHPCHRRLLGFRRPRRSRSVSAAAHGVTVTHR